MQVHLIGCCRVQYDFGVVSSSDEQLFCAGGAYSDAVGVCSHELGDPQLALLLARILEGEQGPLQQALLAKELLPGPDLLLCHHSCCHASFGCTYVVL